MHKGAIAKSCTFVALTLVILSAALHPRPAVAARPTGAAFATFQEIGDPRLPIAVPTTGFVTIARLKLPAGDYVVTASLFLTNDFPAIAPGLAYCILNLDNVRNAQAIDTLPVGEARSQALTAAASLPAGGVAELMCRNNGGSNSTDLSVQTFNLNAIKIGILSFQ